MARSLNYLAASLRIMLKEKKTHAKNLDEKKDVDKVNEEKINEKLRTEVANMNFENERIRQTMKVVDGKVDELVKLSMGTAAALVTMQSLVNSTDEAFVLASTAISEHRIRLKDLDNVQANFIEENAKLKGVLATLMRTTANEIAKVKGDMSTMMATTENVVANFMKETEARFDMATTENVLANFVMETEARFDKEIQRMRGLMCLREFSDEEFGGSDNGG